MTDETADAIENAARNVRELITADVNEVRPSVIEDLAFAFSDAASAHPDLAEHEWMYNGFSTADPLVIAGVLLQWIGKWTDRNDPAMKKAAVDVAYVLGPDHAQTLYRFAVLVTKLA